MIIDNAVNNNPLLLMIILMIVDDDVLLLLQKRSKDIRCTTLYNVILRIMSIGMRERVNFKIQKFCGLSRVACVMGLPASSAFSKFVSASHLRRYFWQFF
jgi:hypothetical protein